MRFGIPSASFGVGESCGEWGTLFGRFEVYRIGYAFFDVPDLVGCHRSGEVCEPVELLGGEVAVTEGEGDLVEARDFRKGLDNCVVHMDGLEKYASIIRPRTAVSKVFSMIFMECLRSDFWLC